MDGTHEKEPQIIETAMCFRWPAGMMLDKVQFTPATYNEPVAA